MFRSRDIKLFVFLWNPQISKSVTSSQALLYNESYTYTYLFWILSTIKIKFGQILVYRITYISNMFLAQCWRLKTSFRTFHDSDEMTTYQDLSICPSWYLPFLILPYSPFQKMKHWKLDKIGYWVIGAGC